MKKSIFLLLILLLTGCATFQISTLNHDSVRIVNNEFELQRLLRTDFQFRYDFAQYALRQPRSFDWNNRILGNRYNYYWNRTQMWNNWVWGFPYYQFHSWSYWGYNYYNWNTWNNHINPNWGRSYVNGRRSNTRIITNRRVVNSNRVVNVPRTRTKPKINYNTKPVIINRRPPNTNNSRPTFNNSRPVINNNSRSNNNNRTRGNSNRKN